jgi:hypothetical protein
MSYSFTSTETNTFTVTHARHMAAKVAADLKRIQRFYKALTDEQINQYEEEVIALLKGGYLDQVTYGFKRDNSWIEPTLRYTAKDLLNTQDDDDPGRIIPGRDVSGAGFYSYLKYNSAWDALPQADKDKFKSQLPFKRTGADEPGVDGYFSSDKTYSAGGRALNRSSVRSW